MWRGGSLSAHSQQMTGYVLWLAIVASVAGLLFGYDTGQSRHEPLKNKR